MGASCSRYSRLLIELAVFDAFDEGVPFAGSKPQGSLAAIFCVPDQSAAAGRAGDLDAIGVKAKAALFKNKVRCFMNVSL
jgi:hypothetical protein